MCTRQLVVAAVITDDARWPGQVLIARRSAPAELAGRWEFPGGKVEPGEDPAAALVREINEELGLTIEVAAELVNPVGGCWPISAAYELRCWLARIVAGRPRAGDSHDEIRWLPSANLGSLDWLDADRPVADLVLRDLLPESP